MKRICLYLMTLTLVTSLGLLYFGVPAQTAACVAADQWVAANSDQLPGTLDEFLAFPSAYRKAIFNRVSPELRSAWAKELFMRFQERPALSDLQQKIVADLIAAATPSTYSVVRSDATLIALAGFQKALTEEFSAEEYAELSPVAAPRNGSLGLRHLSPLVADTRRRFIDYLADRRSRVVSYFTVYAEDCKCRFKFDCFDDCHDPAPGGPGTACVTAIPACEVQSLGCGGGGQSSCIGACACSA